jgi:hypothetical protein
MIELIIIACLKAAPADCIENHVPFEGPMAAMACMMQGQQVAAEWIAAHPKREVTRFDCGPARRST